MQTYYTWIDSPTGQLLLTANESGITQLVFAEGRHPPDIHPSWKASEDPLREAINQLKAFFAGELRAFDLPLSPAGTPFQRKVWAALQQIPYGQTTSYGSLAASIGNPAASRAVGLANGSNPISIIVPCHRVIGSNGKLVGYGGGLPNKRWLLEFEAFNAMG
ncbi:MAG: methylated-DNA--[protein]-cysteine S-methyltransferase [Bryobacteraceae bacterium]